MTRVFAFGTFDGIHAGHRKYLQQAKAEGDHLTVVVACDSTVLRFRGRPATMNENQRQQLVESTGIPDRVIVGSPGDPLDIFRREMIDVAMLGFDHQVSERAVAQAAHRAGQQTIVKRARGYFPILLQNHILKRLRLVGRLLRKTYISSRD